MTRYFLILTFISCMNYATAQDIVPLYDVIPNRIAMQNEEKIVVGNDSLRRVHNVSVPTLTIYKPTVTSNGTVIIICPGGGYSILAIDHEGYDIAKELATWGITAIVLKYRLPDDKIMRDKSIGPLQDAQRALQWVREKADSLAVNAHKIGIMGFSAGGHLASSASTMFNKAFIDNPSHISLRPDFSVLVYPVISMSDSTGHKGSRQRLLGENPTATTIKKFSNDLNITSQTPPAFLVHAKDDKVVPVSNSISYYDKLKSYGVPTMIKFYDKGGHGFGMHNKTSDEKWMYELKGWLTAQKII